MRDQMAWPESTFEWEDEDREHYCGSHWDPFYDSADAVLQRLPDIIPKSTRLMPFGDTYSGPYEIPQSWPKGLQLCWPNPQRGLVTTLRASEGAVEVANVSPYVEAGVQVALEIERVHVWSGGAEAQIEATWGEAPVSFFDLAFASSNRAWYEAGKRLDFVLAGIAYSAGPAADEIDSMPGLSLDGASVFLEVDEWDRDDDSFRGPVLDVSAISDWLGQPGWRVRVCIMRFSDVEDAELEIFVTRRAWTHPEPPQAGRDIEGTLWLQGRLWWASRGQR